MPLACLARFLMNSNERPKVPAVHTSGGKRLFTINSTEGARDIHLSRNVLLNIQKACSCSHVKSEEKANYSGTLFKLNYEDALSKKSLRFHGILTLHKDRNKKSLHFQRIHTLYKNSIVDLSDILSAKKFHNVLLLSRNKCWIYCELLVRHIDREMFFLLEQVLCWFLEKKKP